MQSGDVDDYVDVALAVDQISERPGEELAAKGVEITANGDFDGALLSSDDEREPRCTRSVAMLVGCRPTTPTGRGQAGGS